MDAALVTGMFNFGLSSTNTMAKDVFKSKDKNFGDFFSKSMEKEKGIQNVRGYGKGDQYIFVKIVTPTKLTEKQKQLLQEFAEVSGQVPQGKHEESLFDKVKRAFKGH